MKTKQIISLPWIKVLTLGVGLITSALGLASLLRALSYLMHIPDQLDFTQFYLAAFIFRVAPGTSFYDTTTLSHYSQIVGLSDFMPLNYPPFIALLFYPLSLLSYGAAKTLWLGLNTALTISFIAWAWLRLPASRKHIIWFVVWFVLLLPATTDSLLLGQINPILGLLMLITIECAIRQQRRWDWIAAGSLAFAAAIKLWPLVLAGYFLLRRRYTVALGSIAIFAIVTVTAGLVVGPDMLWQYFGERMPQSGINMAQSPYPNNQSIWGVTTHLFIGGTTRRARLSVNSVQEIMIEPLLRSDLLYWLTVVGFCLATAVVLASSLWYVPSGEGALEAEGYWATLMGVLTVLPFSWNHYAFYLIFPIMILLSDEEWQTKHVMGLGTICLLLTLVHRFSAWLPPCPLLLAFVFLAEVIMEVALIASVIKRSPRFRAWPGL